MATHEEKIDLVSTADTSGFQKFEAATNSLSAAKARSSRENAIFVDSERRVRSNLDELVGGLAAAKNGGDAASVALNHLSEIFQVGFAGTVIGGVSSAIISAVSKAKKEIEDISTALDNASDKAETLREEFSGEELTPTQKGQKQIDQMVKKYEKAKAALENPAAGHDALLLIGEAIGQGTGKAYAKAIADLNELGQRIQAAQDAINNPVGRNAKKAADERKKELAAAVHDRNEAARLAAEFEDSSSKIGEQTMDPKARAASMKRRIGILTATGQSELAEGTAGGQVRGYQTLIKRNALQEELNRLLEETKKKQEEVTATTAREAAIKAHRVQEQKERETKAAERAEEKAESAKGKRSGTHATIIAGSQRSQGGGGGAYSVITRDAVVDEARKHTTLLTDIANSVKINRGQTAAARIAA